uniref:Uncharacterized protein n=1 Tax=Junco hyemalis TaxID=40217 RepID=A0A8C5ILR6_JUNHY
MAGQRAFGDQTPGPRCDLPSRACSHGSGLGLFVGQGDVRGSKDKSHNPAAPASLPREAKGEAKCSPCQESSSCGASRGAAQPRAQRPGCLRPCQPCPALGHLSCTLCPLWLHTRTQTKCSPDEEGAEDEDHQPHDARGIPPASAVPQQQRGVTALAWGDTEGQTPVQRVLLPQPALPKAQVRPSQ